MSKFASAVLALAMVFGVGGAFAADYAKQKVVYHVNSKDEAQLKATLGNIQNHINAVGKDNIELRVVMHGDGVELLRIANQNPDFQSKVVNLKSQHVVFNVCANTLKGRNINYKNDLWDVSEADIVPSGVAELAKLQQQGYLYIKP